MIDLIAHTDGACRGNPGPSSVGCLLSTPTGQLHSAHYAVVGDALTNNQAEYLAILLAVHQATAAGASSLHVHLDSELAARQLTGVYKIKDPVLQHLHRQIKSAAGSMALRLTHVRREHNTAADALANFALDTGGPRPAWVAAALAGAPTQGSLL